MEWRRFVTYLSDDPRSMCKMMSDRNEDPRLTTRLPRFASRRAV